MQISSSIADTLLRPHATSWWGADENAASGGRWNRSGFVKCEREGSQRSPWRKMWRKCVSMPRHVHSWFPHRACTLLICWVLATNNHHRIICQFYSRLTAYALKWQKPRVTSSCCSFDPVFSWNTELLKISQPHSSPVELCKDTPTQSLKPCDSPPVS